MKRFHFSMGSLLRLVESQRDQAHRDWAEAVRRRQVKEGEYRDLLTENHGIHHAAVHDRDRPFRGSDMAHMLDAASLGRLRLLEARKRIAEAAEKEDQLLKRFREVDREREALLRLREKAWEEWQKEERREEIRYLDDLANARHFRKEALSE